MSVLRIVILIIGIVIMFISARYPQVGRIWMFHLAWAFIVLALTWPVLHLTT